MAFTGGPNSSLLAVDRWRDRSVVTRLCSIAPLRLLAPTSRGRAAWVYQSSLGGGFVGGDAVDLEVDVAAGARLFLTSQSSSKVYRRALSRATLDATVHDGGVLVAWPDPIACFAGSSFDQRQRFRLARSAGVIAVDAWTAGRLARGECWAFGRLALRTAIEIGGDEVLSDAVVVSSAHGGLAARMADARAFATITIAGEPLDATARSLGAAIATRPATSQPRIAVSVWPWGAVVRLAAATTEQLVAAIHGVVGQCARDVLGADPFVRKW